MTKIHKDSAKSRRAFLKTGATAAAAGAATLAMPNVARAQEAAVFKFQSTWPAKDIFHEFASDFVTRVNDMGGGRLKFELLAAGAVAKASDAASAIGGAAALMLLFALWVFRRHPALSTH